MPFLLCFAALVILLLAGCDSDGSPAASEPTTAVDGTATSEAPSDPAPEPSAPQVNDERDVPLTSPASATPVTTSTATRADPAATLEPTPPLTTTASVQPRDETPDVVAGDVERLVAGNTAFSLDLYAAMSEEDGNIFYSPYSISLALSMAYGGARGTTESQMADTLRFNLPQDRLHQVFNTLDLDLNSRASRGDGEGFDLNIANSAWGQAGHGFLPAYLDTLAVNYGGHLREVNFRRLPDDARERINDWVFDETEGRIEDLIAPGSITSFTRLVLANAVYFKAKWEQPFDEGATSRGRFHTLDGTTRGVEMRRQTETLAYARGDNYQAVELPYQGGDMSMIILLPDAGRFNEFEDFLDSHLLDSATKNLARHRVNLTMPKFKMDARLGLVATLEAMGMPNAFDATRAEFQGMDGLSCLAGDDECLSISDVVHKAYVSVDEAGTEAAAATAVMVGITSAEPEEPVMLTIDRPFILFIQDRETRTVLFMGRVVEL